MKEILIIFKQHKNKANDKVPIVIIAIWDHYTSWQDKNYDKTVRHSKRMIKDHKYLGTMIYHECNLPGFEYIMNR